MRTYAVNPKYQSLADEILAIPERFARALAWLLKEDAI